MDTSAVAPDPYQALIDQYAKSSGQTIEEATKAINDIIAQLQSQVAAELEKSTGDPAVQGYQADRTRVYQICGAIYHVIRTLGIRYVNPPSSFGVPGQKIRLPDTVCRLHLGTCLETTLLFASLMEHCELHPVILL